MPRNKKFETDAIRTQLERSQQGEHSVPLFLTSSFVFDDAEDMRASFADEKEGNIYSRFTNPNKTVLTATRVWITAYTTGRNTYPWFFLRNATLVRS